MPHHVNTKHLTRCCNVLLQKYEHASKQDAMRLTVIPPGVSRQVRLAGGDILLTARVRAETNKCMGYPANVP